MSYLISTAARKCEPITPVSTGTFPTEWREYWGVYGTSWKSLIELHLEIVDRLRTSASWASSS